MAAKPTLSTQLAEAMAEIETLRIENEALKLSAHCSTSLMAETMAEIETLRAKNVDLEARLEKARSVWAADQETIKSLSAKKTTPRVNKPTAPTSNEVTWTGVSRINGLPCRRIGKGPSSWLEDLVNGVWVRRGAARQAA